MYGVFIGCCTICCYW